MIVLEMAQGTPEWLAARCGVPTASCFDRIITPTGKPSTQAEAYAHTLLAEQITGVSEGLETNSWMRRGTELEPEARDYYSLVTGATVEQVGFCLTDDETCGCSPDGLVGSEGLLEIKCPAPSTHIEYLLTGQIVGKYYPQVQGQLWVTGRKWVDFVSYCPGIEALIIRVKRDAKFQARLTEEMSRFQMMLAAKREVLRQRGVL